MSTTALADFALGLTLSFILGTLIIGGYALNQDHIAYWLAYLVATALVFLGYWILDATGADYGVDL